MANNLKFNWTGDLDDDCTCTSGDYVLRAELLYETEDGSERWWWTAYYKDEEITAEEEPPLAFSGDQARWLAERIALAHWAEMKMADGGES